MAKVFVVDLEKCNGCYCCQVACKDETAGNEWMPYSKPQPDTGQFWCKVKQQDHGQVPKVRVEHRPVWGAQSEAIREYAPEVLVPREDGLIVIDPEKATGRKDLAEKFEGIYWNEELQIPQGCTGCAHLVDREKLPHCVDACATNALSFGEEEEFADKIAQAVSDFDDEGMKGHVYYINPFRLFLSGEVWDEAADEVIIGATATLTDVDGGVSTAETDCYGDFWFKHIMPGIYTLDIAADGYDGVAGKVVELTESLNIGDFPLHRA